MHLTMTAIDSLLRAAHGDTPTMPMRDAIDGCGELAARIRAGEHTADAGVLEALDDATSLKFGDGRFFVM